MQVSLSLEDQIAVKGMVIFLIIFHYSLSKPDIDNLGKRQN